MVFGLGYTFIGKDWCDGYKTLSYSLKCYPFGANLRIITKFPYTFFTHKYNNFYNKNNSNFRYVLIQRLHINHQKGQLGRHPALGKRRYAKWIIKLNSDFSNLNLILWQEFPKTLKLMTKYKLHYEFKCCGFAIHLSGALLEASPGLGLLVGWVTALELLIPKPF